MISEGIIRSEPNTLTSCPPSESMKHPLTQERKTGPPIPLSFDQFQLRHMTLDNSIVDPPGETSSHCAFVFLDPSSKGLSFWKIAAVHLGKPGPESVD